MLRSIILAAATLATGCVVRAGPPPIVVERRVAPPRPGYVVYRPAAPRCSGVWVEGYYDAWGAYHPGYWRCY